MPATSEAANTKLRVDYVDHGSKQTSNLYPGLCGSDFYTVKRTFIFDVED